MGEGGTVTLVNGSPYTWINTFQHQNQMNAWSFPANISPGAAVDVYVEWGQKLLTNWKDDAAEVTYQLQGTNNNFQVQARNTKGFDIQVYFQALSTPNHPQGSTLDLGWTHNGHVTFILSGQPSKGFWSTGGPADWMHQNLPVIGSRTLKQLAIPGTHDAGMSSRTGGTAFGNSCNTITQTKTIGGQLALGARWFDIRPVISGGAYYTGHYDDITELNSWQGANGESIDNVIADINAFTASNKELIIVKLSHDFDTDLGNSNYPPLTEDQYNGLLQKLTGLNHLYVAPNPSTVDLTSLTLNQFIGSGNAAVVVVVDSSISLGSYNTRGFYNYGTQLNPFDSYSDTSDLNTMISDQLSKMAAQRPSNYFLLSWTLTLDTAQSAKCLLNANGSLPLLEPLAPSILNLAATTYSSLYTKLLPACSPGIYPNIILVDGLSDGNVAALAVAINTLFPA